MKISRILFLALSVCVCSKSFAVPFSLDASNSGVSAFEKLGSFFDQGVLPSRSELKGWWSGRCYTEGSPYSAIGRLLTVDDLPLSEDRDGPLFPPPLEPETNFVLGVWGWAFGDNNYPERFDEPLSSDDKLYFINAISYYGSKSELIGHVQDNSWTSVSDSAGVTFQLRKHRDVFVVQVRGKAGIENCYFFKKVDESTVPFRNR